jgi:hypothetical protein
LDKEEISNAFYKVKHAFIRVLFILLWSNEHEKTEEKTKREIEPSGTARLDGRSQRYVQASAWGD